MVPQAKVTVSVLKRDIQLLHYPVTQRLKAKDSTDTGHQSDCSASYLSLTLTAHNGQKRKPQCRLHPMSSLPRERPEQRPCHLVMLSASQLGHILHYLQRWHYPYSASSSATETSQTTTARGVQCVKQGGTVTEGDGVPHLNQTELRQRYCHRKGLPAPIQLHICTGKRGEQWDGLSKLQNTGNIQQSFPKGPRGGSVTSSHGIHTSAEKATHLSKARLKSARGKKQLLEVVIKSNVSLLSYSKTVIVIHF